MNANEVSQRLAQDAADVASFLLPQGKRAGQEWKVGSVNGEPGQSLSVRVKGAKAGVWSDFSSGESGDLLDLFVAVRGCSMAEALREAKQYLGIRDTMSPREQERVAQPKHWLVQSLLGLPA